MTKEFKIKKYKDATVYVMESASGGAVATGSGSTVSKPIGGVQRRSSLIAQEGDTVKVPVTQKPRQGTLKTQTGAGAHRDKKKEQKQGKEKHKKPFAETVDEGILDFFKKKPRDPNNFEEYMVYDTFTIFYDPTDETFIVKGRGEWEDKLPTKEFPANSAMGGLSTAQSYGEYRTGGIKEPIKINRGVINRGAHEGLEDPKDNPCWDTHKPVGTKKKAGKTVPNCVPKESMAQEDHEVSMASNELKSIHANAKKLLTLVQQYGENGDLEAWQQSKITKAADYLNSVLQSIGGEQDALDADGDEFSEDGVGKALAKGAAGLAVGGIAAAGAPALVGLLGPVLGIGIAGYGAYNAAKMGMAGMEKLWDMVSNKLGGDDAAAEFAKAHMRAAAKGEGSFVYNGSEFKTTLKPTEVQPAAKAVKELSESRRLARELAESWSSVKKKINEDFVDAEATFDTIETIVENIAEQNGVDFETVWEDFDLASDIELYALAEDWQKVNKRDKTDGMSRKAVKAYRRENPGSKLKTAVTTKPSKLKKGGKAAKRRKSFCARMSGMKKAHAGAKTKRDPDSPINKALRRWNCEEDHSTASQGFGKGGYDTYAGTRHGRGVAEGSGSTVANLDAVFNEPDFDRLEHIWPALEAGDKEEALRQINHYLRKGKNRAWWGDLQALDIQIDPSDVENSLVKWSKPVDQGVSEKLNPQSPVDTWVDDFQKADPNKYHQFKNKTPAKKAQMAVAAHYAANEPSKKK